MSLNLVIFEDPEDLLRYIDRKITELTRRLAELHKAYNDIKIKAEKYIKLEELFSELFGKEVLNIREIDLRGIKIVMDARPTDELKVYEEVISSLQDKIEALERIEKEVIVPLVSKLRELKGVSLIVELSNDIPSRILIKFR